MNRLKTEIDQKHFQQSRILWMPNQIILQSNYRDAGVEGAEQLFVKYGERLISGSLQAAVFSVSGPLKRDMAEIIYLVGKISNEVAIFK